MKYHLRHLKLVLIFLNSGLKRYGVRVKGKESRQCLGFSPVDDLLGCNYSLVICHSFRCHPFKLIAQVGNMLKFEAAENDPSSKVTNFLDPSSFWYHCHRLGGSTECVT